MSRRALGIAILVVAATVALTMAALFLGPAMLPRFSDGEVRAVTPPPSPRTDCEATFYRHLFADFDATSYSNRPLTAAGLMPVFDACTHAGLYAADRYFGYVSGGTMAYLGSRRLFNGPLTVQAGQYEAWCDEPVLSATLACTT